MFQVSRNVQDQLLQGHLFTWYFGVYAAYRIKGRQIKVLSDHHIPVDPNLKYNLTLRIEGNKRMKVYIGFTCYDQNKNVIKPIQICREETQLVYEGFDQHGVFFKGTAGKNWGVKELGTKTAIAVYTDGDTQTIPPISHIIANNVLL